MIRLKSIKLYMVPGILLALIIFVAGCGGGEEPEKQSIPSDAKLVCLFFDDGYWNQYHVVLPVLLKHEFQATFGIITGHIGTGHDLWEYMDENELRVLADSGMDIASHTRTHPDLTANLTDEQLRVEIIDSRTHLEEMGFRVSTFLYPYYLWDERVIQYVKDAGYTCARGGWSEKGVYNLSAHQPGIEFHVPAWQISNQTFDEFKTIVAKANSYSAVSLVYHFILDDGPEGLCTPVASFREQMSYLKNNGFTVVLLPELLSQ